MAPPVYRPNAGATQRKAQGGPGLQGPPVYRPQTAPPPFPAGTARPTIAAIQRHTTHPEPYRPQTPVARRPQTNLVPSRPSAPPVFRSPSSPLQRMAAPPVYRPALPVQRSVAPPSFSAIGRGAAKNQLSSVVQRFVMRRASSKGWLYCSSFDQSTTFDNEEDARKHDAMLAAAANTSLTTQQRGGEASLRFPTPYSYTHTAVTSQLSDKPQGPHFFPFCQTDSGFKPLNDRAELLQLFFEQVPTPDEAAQMLLEEKSGKLGVIDWEIQRLNYDYQSLYATILNLLSNEGSDVQLLRYYIRRIMEMHAYATYGWKSKTQASGRSLKYKGETKGEVKVDTGGRWVNPKQAEKYQKNREKLHQGGYKIDQEMLDYDGQLDGEYVTMEELIQAVIVGQQQVGDTIHLFPTGEWVIHRVEFLTEGEDKIIKNARVVLRRKGG